MMLENKAVGNVLFFFKYCYLKIYELAQVKMGLIVIFEILGSDISVIEYDVSFQ